MQIPTTFDGLRQALTALGYPNLLSGVEVDRPGLQQELLDSINWELSLTDQTSADHEKVRKATVLIKRFAWPDPVNAGGVVTIKPAKKLPPPEVMDVEVIDDGDAIVVEPAAEQPVSADAEPMLEGVKAIVDTATVDAYVLGNAAVREGDKVVAWHVTDNPDAIIKAIKAKRNFVQSYGPKGAHAELGPGFYCSAVPNFWVGRSSNKWSFVTRMEKAGDAAAIKKLCNALMKEVNHEEQRSRITKAEADKGRVWINQVLAGEAGPGMLVSMLANMPYGIEFWRASWLEEAGLEDYVQKPPKAVKVQVIGKLAEMERDQPSFKVQRALRKQGLAGMYKRGGFAGNPEMVIWSGANLRVLDVEEVG